MATTMSVKEVAAELGLSVPTVWRLVRRRELGHAKCGRRVLVPSEEIQRFLRARFTPAAEAAVASRLSMGRSAQAKQPVEAMIELADEGR